MILHFISFFSQDVTYLFLQGDEGREKERERNSNRLPLILPQLGTWPATQACALTGNQTGELSVCSPTFNPLSQGWILFREVWRFLVQALVAEKEFSKR